VIRIHLSAPDVGALEREYLLSAFDSGWIAPSGPDLTAFEKDVGELTGWATVALSSGTAALHLALLGVGVGPGDTVLTSTLTFAASANAIVYCGAEPVFLDSDAASWNMSASLLCEELDACRQRGRLPRAVVVVDLYGQCADYDELRPLCSELGIPVIEDAAEAVGSTYRGRPAGTLADVGLWSFNGNKVMTTSGGGMLMSPDPTVAARAHYLATQARQPVPHYEHTDVGFNYRMSNLLAALGRAQLSRLPEMIARRREINSMYRQLLSAVDGITFMPIPDWSGWNGWLTCLLFDDPGMPARVREHLENLGIESRPLWKPMHQQPVFRNRRNRLDGTSDRLYRHGLCLPSGSALTDVEIAEVSAEVATSAELHR
jgi:dTDP-4-amino-4,6-dideoxygalactose transaminase